MSERRLQYITIEGPIGVGKTSLARRLAESLGHELLLEQAEENPFLERFYRDPVNAALPAQLFFLFQRVRQIQELRQSDMFSPVRVTDFLLEKDRLFAELTLGSEEFRLYEQVYEQVAVDPPVPDLVVYLQAPVDVLMARIQRRGIIHERDIQPAYLQRLNEAYMKFFHHYRAAPLLIVNAAVIDPIHSEADYEQLLDRIVQSGTGRAYFNPAPSLPT